MKMKESLQTIFDEYCGADVHKVNDFTKEQLKQTIRDYLLEKGLEDYVVTILVNEFNVGQIMNIIQKAIDMDINIIYTLQANEVLQY